VSEHHHGKQDSSQVTRDIMDRDGDSNDDDDFFSTGEEEVVNEEGLIQR
jgi:hypothetical protein